jgi:hypothetical protein
VLVAGGLDIGDVICHQWGGAQGVRGQPHRPLPEFSVL